MIVTRGEEFKQGFILQDSVGKPLKTAGSQFVLVVERKGFMKQLYLSKRLNEVTVTIPAETTKDFDADSYSYKIVTNNVYREVVQEGILQVING